MLKTQLAKRFVARGLAITAVLLWTGEVAAWCQQASGNWPQFRGYQAEGVGTGDLPLRWDATTGDGIKWRVAVPGLGLSSPVIWGDKLFLTTAVSEADQGGIKTGLFGNIASVEDRSEHVWKVLCYDKNTGKLLWEKDVHRGDPKIKRHPKSSHANPTPATDGEHLVVFFGSEGLYCLDLDGNILWKRDFGVLDAGYFQVPEAQWEFASSPVIHDDKVAVLADVQNDSFLAVLRLEDGREVWRASRSDVPTWGTPLIITVGGQTQAVVNGYRHAGAYDFETGEEIWSVNGGGDIPIPTPIFGDGKFFLTSGHGSMSPVYAVPHTARGEIRLTEQTGDPLAWLKPRSGSYIQTPLLLNGLLYVSRWNGILNCYRAENGELVYQERLGTGAFTASPVGGDGKVYVGDEEGDFLVIEAGTEYKVLAVNRLGEPTLATPAISDGVLYFRTINSLIAVE